jgi:hypothetical protein
VPLRDHLPALLPSFLLIAFVFSPKIIGPIRLGDLLLVAAIPLLWSRFKALRRETLPPPAHLYLIWLGWSAIATTIAILAGWNERGGAAVLGVARFAEIGLLGLAAATGGESGRRRLRQVAAGALVVIAGIGLVEFLSAYLRAGEYFVRVYNSGLFLGEANHVAGAAVILAAAIPAILPLALIIAAMAGARTALIVVLILALRDWVVTRNHRRALFTVALLTLFLVLAPEAHRLRFTELPAVRATYAGPHVDRWTAWSVAIREAPVATGVGLGARPSSVYESAYVHLYAETGLPGLLLWLGLLGAFVVRGRSDEAEDARATPLALALLGLGLTANVAFIARIIGPAAILLGAGIGRNVSSAEPRTTKTRRHQEIKNI